MARGPWQTHLRLGAVLELVFGWLRGAELARAGAACGAWRAAARRAGAWRRLLCARAPRAHRAVRALAQLYEGVCPWRSLLVAAEAPWRRVARLAPSPPPAARLVAAALARAGDLLALAAEDCSFTVWVREHQGCWRQAGAGSVASLGWSGVTSAEWAPHAPRLLLAGPVLLSAQRGALAVLRPVTEGSWSAWRVVSRTSGSGGCWAGASFLSLELRRLSAPEHVPHFATDVWLNAATQEADNEFAGVAARVLRVYNEARAVITQVVCAEVPLDACAAREWAEAEEAARAQDEADGDAPPADVHSEEQAPGEAYYRATYDPGRDVARDAQTAWVRVALLACGGVLSAHALRRDRPPPLRVRGALRERVEARRAKKLQEAAAAALGEEAEATPEPSAAELRARCDAPGARLRLAAPALGLAVHNSGRAVWASAGGGAACASLPGLRVLRLVRAAPGPGPRHYLRPGAIDEYFGSPVGGGGSEAAVWGAAPGAGVRLRPRDDRAPALALLLAPAAPARAAPPTALLLTEAALHVFQCTAPRARPPPCACRADDSSADDSSADDSSTDDSSADDSSADDSSAEDDSADDCKDATAGSDQDCCDDDQ